MALDATCEHPDAPRYARQMCERCYHRWYRANRRGPSPQRCEVDSCPRPHLARGLCAAHYQRQRNHGDPTALDADTVRALLAWLRDQGAHDTWIAEHIGSRPGSVWNLRTEPRKWVRRPTAIAVHTLVRQVAAGDLIPPGLPDVPRNVPADHFCPTGLHPTPAIRCYHTHKCRCTPCSALASAAEIERQRRKREEPPPDERRFPVEALVARLNLRPQTQEYVTVEVWSQLADLVGVNRRQVYLYRASGLPLHLADEWAIKAGLHPSDVWPEWFDGIEEAA